MSDDFQQRLTELGERANRHAEQQRTAADKERAAEEQRQSERRRKDMEYQRQLQQAMDALVVPALLALNGRFDGTLHPSFSHGEMTERTLTNRWERNQNGQSVEISVRLGIPDSVMQLTDRPSLHLSLSVFGSIGRKPTTARTTGTIDAMNVEAAKKAIQDGVFACMEEILIP